MKNLIDYIYITQKINGIVLEKYLNSWDYRL